MATHFDNDPAEQNSIRNAAKKEDSQMEIVDKIWTNIVKEWRPQSEVMFLRYSGFALPLLSFLPAYELDQARNGFQLNKKIIGKANWRTRSFVTYASFAISSGLTLLSHIFFILSDVLIEKTKCPMCVYTRGIGLQTLTATILPTAVSAFGSNLRTFRPIGVNLPQGILSTIIRSSGIIGASIATNLISSYFCTDQMQREWFHIQLEMAKFEKAAKEEEIEGRLQEYSEYDPKKFIDNL